jgi:glycosyltransferase involved in cell wall biosynthesis
VHAGIADYFHNAMGVPKNRLEVIANGVHIGARSEVARSRNRAALGLPDGQFCFLFAGRLEAVKDVSTLLRGVALVAEDVRRDIKLIIAGDGSERITLEQLAHQLGIASVVAFLGIRTDIPKLLTAADGFIMTSVTEGLPMALIEAMGAGVPSIATAVGGIPDLFSGGCGILINPSRPEEVAGAITDLATNPDVRNRTATRGLEKAKVQYNLDSVVTRYLRALGLPARWPRTP